MTTNDVQEITDAVQARYGTIALNVLNEQASGCCTLHPGASKLL